MHSTIRKAEEHDVNELSILFNLYRVYYKKNSDVETAKKFLTERILKKESIIFIATRENKIVGFTKLYPLFSSLTLTSDGGCSTTISVIEPGRSAE